MGNVNNEFVYPRNLNEILSDSKSNDSIQIFNWEQKKTLLR